MARRSSGKEPSRILAALPGEAARQLLSDWLDRLIAGKAAPEIQLDLLEAAAKRSEPEFRDMIKKYESTKPRDDPLSAYREVLAGGARERGRTIFTSRSDVECVRCHKVRASGGDSSGGEVGPDLSGVGARLSRADLLESILSPDKKIAQGFESVVLATSDGKVHTGILRGEDAKEVRLMTAEGKSVTRAERLDRRAQARALGHARRRGRQAEQDRAPRLDRVSRQPEDRPKAVAG